MLLNRKLYGIKELAESIALEHWTENSLNLSDILRSQDINFYESEFGDEFDGVLECSNGEFSIFLNTDRENSLNTLRGRFTLGHELGHFFIDEHRLPMELGKLNPHPSKLFTSDYPIEREADWFSCNLLMPEEKFKKSKKNYAGFERVLKLSSLFKTSITSAAIRYVRVIDQNAALIFWGKDKSQWFITGKHYTLTNYRGKTTPLPPRGSATEQAINEGCQEIVSKGTVLSEWKSRVKHWHHKNDILKEEAFNLGKFGTLTLLTPEKI